MAAGAVSGNWRRLHTLGRGASGAVVSLAADGASGELFAVKSAAAAHAAAALRRERGVLAGLSSPHVVRCVGGAEGADGSYQLFLEYAPGGSLADEVARNGGSLGERAVRAYAADVARGLAYLHARSVVHGDVKARNVVIGADGRAKLADFGSARAPGSARAIGGTPAFMAPEVARGEEQGPAADVWALGCTVIEMATGRAPWSDMDDVLAALHRIGYTDAVPEVPSWLSAEAKDFLACCFARDAADRWTAAELLEHPFVAFAGADEKARWVSPKSTLDAAFWESESDDEADEMPEDAAERIKSLACSASAFPDWDCEEGWIDVLGEQQSEVQVASSAPSKVSGVAAVPAGGLAVGGGVLSDDELETEDVPFAGDAPAADASVGRQSKRCSSSDCHVGVLPFQLVLCCNGVIIDEIKLWLPTKFAVLLCLIFLVHTLLTPNCSSVYETDHDRCLDVATEGKFLFIQLPLCVPPTVPYRALCLLVALMLRNPLSTPFF
ncbi:mitogen-activated protein kinase kinase kinase 18 [Setaria italica]|uniref:mitogen-activated protein kinase kinase kinase 18 n=1 Tax=Setaria italica TaxID=4555 RepID=UPI000350EC9E|nr:mitogen-activated protein kinase kinase kinase 18 [Setaria italica]